MNLFVDRKDHYSFLERKVSIYFPFLEKKRVIYWIVLKLVLKTMSILLLEGDQVKQIKVQRDNVILVLKTSADSI